MNIRLITFLLLIWAGNVRASDSLRISMPKAHYAKGDSLDIKCVLPYFSASNLSSATLNVWIEDLSRTKRWKFRYPIINGNVDAGLAIANTIPDGQYAITYQVQRGFFKIYGQVKNPAKKDSTLYYMMVQTNDAHNTYLDVAKVAGDGNFHLKSTLFADSAFFIFTPTKKVKTNSLSIHIETPLDSAFIPVLMDTKFFSVGSSGTSIGNPVDTSRYVFNSRELAADIVLPNVTVTAKARTKLQLYDDQYSSGLFRNTDVLIFDGLGSDEIANSMTVLMYLQARVPGLTIERDGEGREVAKWRRETAELYLDEFRVSATDYDLLATSDIAMIKVYRPPARLSSFSGAAGAIAIYTKKGDFINSNSSRHSFIVKGYTAVDGVWK